MLLISATSLRPHTQPKNWTAGFSLLELLTVICLVGILSSIAIGWYGGNTRDVIEHVTNQRNAQEIVSLGVYATIGGADFVIPGDKQASAAKLIGGVTGQQGMWKGKHFSLTNLRPTDLPGALTFVKFESDLLLYDPAGQQP
ncbi:MAG: prepilin-type N-terminal cleavage/methylation domain-containing protein [Prosthecobacter sp.]|uniref:pilus assembly FimT family protein n=1 Tax=Prosthecobacter sp. TaxID=1965333 RepID=UPI00260B72B9|nr:type II secretion system protein [Prosthecobacter sp.]MCF7788685.1 prepilin-type N-terminal cleavage/methylation domain-containing protein [Prosthecobacter sp.]